MRAPTLLEACRDPGLLGLDLWPGQAPIVEAIDSGRHREIVLALGRRSGKSIIAAAVAVHDAAFRDLSAHLRPGEGRHVVCVAPSREQAGIVLGFARDLLTGSALLREAIEAETADSITVRQPATGAAVTIKTVPCSARTARGLAISTLIEDEMAHMIDATDGPAVARRVHRALAPAVAQFGAHGRVLCLSTPWGRDNLFCELYECAASGEVAHALAIHAPTWDINPTIPAEFFEAERQRDPDGFRSEYGAEFLASGGAFLDFAEIQAAIADRGELSPGLDLIAPVAALDVAFARDPFALAIVGRHPVQRDRLRLALVRSWRPGRGAELAVEDVLGEVAGVCRRYGATRVFVDQFCSAPVRQSLSRRGLTAREVTMSAASKTAIYGTLKSKLYAGELELYRHEGLLAELGRIEAHYSAGSANVRIPRSGGSHGDLAQALALAVHAIRHGAARKQRIITGGREGFRITGGSTSPVRSTTTTRSKR